MTYDFRGSWDAQGPTNFHSNLYPDESSPGDAANRSISVETAIDTWRSGGVPAKKLVVGVPFYGRGWSGVAAANDVLYQSATAAAPGTYEAGFEDYKVLATRSAAKFRHPTTHQLWSYDGSQFWSYDDPPVIREKMEYIKREGLGGAMIWSMDGDTSDGQLMSAVDAGLR